MSLTTIVQDIKNIFAKLNSMVVSESELTSVLTTLQQSLTTAFTGFQSDLTNTLSGITSSIGDITTTLEALPNTLSGITNDISTLSSGLSSLQSVVSAIPTGLSNWTGTFALTPATVYTTGSALTFATPPTDNSGGAVTLSADGTTLTLNTTGLYLFAFSTNANNVNGDMTVGLYSSANTLIPVVTGECSTTLPSSIGFLPLVTTPMTLTASVTLSLTGFSSTSATACTLTIVKLV